MGVCSSVSGLVSISLKIFTLKVALLGLLLLVVGASFPGVDAIRILIVHPLYAGSHALTLQVW